jgi:hypothetical protein
MSALAPRATATLRADFIVAPESWGLGLKPKPFCPRVPYDKQPSFGVDLVSISIAHQSDFPGGERLNRKCTPLRIYAWTDASRIDFNDLAPIVEVESHPLRQRVLDSTILWNPRLESPKLAGNPQRAFLNRTSENHDGCTVSHERTRFLRRVLMKSGFSTAFLLDNSPSLH